MAHDPLVVLRLSPAQARAVLEALDLLACEAGAELAIHPIRPEVTHRTRTKLHDAMDAVCVSP